MPGCYTCLTSIFCSILILRKDTIAKQTTVTKGWIVNMKKESSANAFARDCIYTALLQLMEQQPYSEITVTDIAKRAGVSRMTYYRHYQSKDDVLIKHLDTMLYSLEKNLNTDNMQWEKVWTVFFEKLRLSQLISAILRAELLEKLFQCVSKHAYYIFQEVLLWDMTDLHNTLLVNCQVGVFLGILRFLQENEQTVNIGQVVEFQKELSATIQQLAHHHESGRECSS